MKIFNAQLSQGVLPAEQASVYLYNLIEEEVRVEKMEFTKAASKLI